MTNIGRKKKKVPTISGYYRYLVDKGYSTPVILTPEVRARTYAEYLQTLK